MEFYEEEVKGDRQIMQLMQSGDLALQLLWA